MNWVLIVLSLVWPMVQPVMQQSVQRMQARYQQPAQPVYRHDGQRWWKYEGGQWYYEVTNDNRNDADGNGLPIRRGVREDSGAYANSVSPVGRPW